MFKIGFLKVIPNELTIFIYFKNKLEESHSYYLQLDKRTKLVFVLNG
jgi:hypothetical protein